MARRLCKPCGVTIGLLPDFLASRLSGTLDELEEAAAEGAASQWKAAEQARPQSKVCFQTEQFGGVTDCCPGGLACSFL